MHIEVSTKERDLLKKILDSYLSELRGLIVETKGDKTGLHEEEDMVKGLQQKVSEHAMVL